MGCVTPKQPKKCNNFTNFSQPASRPRYLSRKYLQRASRSYWLQHCRLGERRFSKCDITTWQRSTIMSVRLLLHFLVWVIVLGLGKGETRTLETVYRVAICPRGNLSYMRNYPINNTVFNLIYPVGSWIYLPYKWFCPITGYPINDFWCTCSQIFHQAFQN